MKSRDARPKASRWSRHEILVEHSDLMKRARRRTSSGGWTIYLLFSRFSSNPGRDSKAALHMDDTAAVPATTRAGPRDPVPDPRRGRQISPDRTQSVWAAP